LHRSLAIYKNQEYPEKLLHINNLRKKLDDLYNLNSEERENLEDMIRSDKLLQHNGQVQVTQEIADEISKVAIGEMHYSLKDMALFNKTLKKEIEFLKNLIEKMKLTNEDLEHEVKELRRSDRRSSNFRNIVFEHLFKKKEM
jgi:hypothetical protein